MSFLKALLIWLAQILFGRPVAQALPASREAVSFFSDPATAKLKQDFLENAKRPDWNDDDCLSAKVFVEDMLANDRRQYIALPIYYDYLLDDVTIDEALNVAQDVSARLTSEKQRRLSS
jgi:hypothetical protein